jgi:hypothetical protein
MDMAMNEVQDKQTKRIEIAFMAFGRDNRLAPDARS